MPTLNLAYIFELSLRYARKYLYSIAMGAFFVLLVSMFVSFVAAFVIFYNLVSSFLSFSSTTSGDMMSKVYGLLSCIGFTTALNDSKITLISSVMFLLWRILYAQVVSLYFTVLRIIAPLI